jgi:flagellar assembly protein FliH
MLHRETRAPLFLKSTSARPHVEPCAFAGNAVPREAPVAAGPEPATAAPVAAELRLARQDAMTRVSEAVRALGLAASRLAEQARGDSIEIGFQVASRILEMEVKSNPEALFALVRSALRKAGDSRRVVVRMSPGDVAVMETDRERLGEGGPSTARVEVVPDATLASGDCVVDTDFGQIDGRLATRLSEARRAVNSVLEGGAA